MPLRKKSSKNTSTSSLKNNKSVVSLQKGSSASNIAELEPWEEVQMRIYTNWVQDKVKETGLNISSLPKDLEDGRVLIKLIELLSGKKIPGKVHQKPSRSSHYSHNLAAVFSFMKEEEQLPIINLNPAQIQKGNEREILGLIWQLILRYQITDAGHGSKSLLLDWLRKAMPDKEINNFTSDWRDGFLLSSLVNFCDSSLIIDHLWLDSDEALENVENAMKLAEVHLNIPMLLKPEDFINEKPDENSIMTYLSHFCSGLESPGQKMILNWIRDETGDDSIVNLTDAWVDGKKLGLLLQVTSTSGFDEYNDLEEEEDKVQACKIVMEAAEKLLGIKMTLTPAQFSDRTLNPILRMMYLFQFYFLTRHAKVDDLHIPEETGYGASVWLDISLPEGSTDRVDASVKGNLTGEVPTDVQLNEDGKYRIKFDAEIEDLYTLSVSVGKMRVKGSPFSIDLTPPDPDSVYLANTVLPQKAGIPVILTLGAADTSRGKLTVEATGEESGEVPYLVDVISATRYKISFIPLQSESYMLDVRLNGMHIKDSPFVFPLNDLIQPEMITIGEPVKGQVGEAVTIPIDTLEAGKDKLTATCSGKVAGTVEVLYNPPDNPKEIIFHPPMEDVYSVSVFFGSSEVMGSPFDVSIPLKPPHADKVRLVQSPSGSLNSGHQIKLVFDGSEAGEGKMTASCTGKHCGDVETRVNEKLDNYWDVTFTPRESDVYEFSVLWSGEPVDGSPFHMNLIPKDSPDPAKCKLIGFPDPSTILLTNEVIQFKVDTTSAGKGYLDIVCRVEKEEVGEYEEDRVSMASTGTRGSENTILEAETEGLEPIREEEDRDVTGVKDDQQHQREVEKEEIGSAQPSGEVTEKKDGVPYQPSEDGEKETPSEDAEGSLAQAGSMENHEEVRPVAKLSIEPSEEDSRVFNVTYAPVEGGICSMNIYWSDQPINDSPFSLKIYDPQLVQYNEPISVQIKTAYKRKNLKVKLQRRDGGIVKHHVKMDKITTGNYILIFTPSQPDVYLMHVSAKGKPIMGSPFVVSYFKPEPPEKKLEEVVQVTALDSTEEPTSPLPEKSLDDSFTEQVHVIRQASKPENSSIEDDFEAVHLVRDSSLDGVEGTQEEGRQGAITGLSFEDCRFIVGTSNKLKIFCDDLGEGAFQFLSKPSTHADVVVTEEAMKENTYWASITPKKAGKCDLLVRYGGSDISGSPFTVNFLARGNAKKCMLITPSDCPQSPNDVEKMFCISTKGAGKGKVTASMKSMSTSNDITARVEQHSKHHYHLKYVPTEGLNYMLTVRFDDVDISGSPYQILLGNPSHCKVEGEGLVQPWSGRPNKFSVDSINAGPGDLSVIIEKEGEVLKLEKKISKIENFKYEVDYQPKSPGIYWITVKWNDTNIPDSPYMVVCKKPLSPDQLHVVNPAPVTYHGKPAELMVAVDQVIEEESKLSVSVQSAEGVKYDGEISKKDDQSYSVSIHPPELGKYSVAIQWDKEDIVGSPFEVTTVFPPLASDFSVDAAEREMGLLSMKVTGPICCFHYGELSTSVLNANTEVANREVPVEIEELSDKERAINFKLRRGGEFILSILYDSEDIQGSPFNLTSTDATQCYQKGHGLVASLINQPNHFSVFTENGGPGELVVIIKAEVDDEEDILLVPDVTARDNTVFDVSYTPNFTGKYTISVLWDSQDIPGSPFEVICCDPSRYSLSKPPTEGFLGKPIKIGINEATLGPSYEKLEVFARGKDHKRHAGEVVKGDDGNYLCTVQPPDLGKYLVHVQCNGYNIPGTPFKIHNMPNPIPEKVVVSGPGIEDGSIGQSGSFQIDVSEAGHGYINLKVQGPKRSFNVNMTGSKEDHRKIIAEYSPTYMGKYLISVLWSGVHVPNSPFSVNITESGSHDSHRDDVIELEGHHNANDGQTAEDAL